MTSINRNIPTRTNYVPTTTQQPTNTNTTASADAAVATGSSVPTPTSCIVYTASAPKTNTPEYVEILETLQREIDEAKAYLDKCQEEEELLTQKIWALSDQVDKIEEKLSKAGSTESFYLTEELLRIESEIEELCDLRSALYSKIEIAELLYKDKLKQMHALLDSVRTNFSDVPNYLSSTITGDSPTSSSGVPTVTTGYVPYYPTAS